MNKKIIAFLIAAMAAGMFAPAASAAVVGTLDYTLSTTTLNLDSSGKGSFSLTVPKPTTVSAYAGVQFYVQMPPGATINSVDYNLASETRINPSMYPSANEEYTYNFAVYDTYVNKFTNDLTCTVNVTCPGSGIKIIKIERIHLYWFSGREIDRTDERVTDTETDITVVPSGESATADANLSRLTITGATLAPPFNSGVTSYTAAVNNNVDSVSVIATSNNPRATVTGTGLARLNVGANTITVTVTAEDGVAKKDYVIVVTRGDLNSTPIPTASPSPTPSGSPSPSPTPGGSPSPTTIPPAGGGGAIAGTTPTPIPGIYYAGVNDDGTPGGDTVAPAPTLDETNEKAYLFGYPDGTFLPEADITRAETASMLFALSTNEDKAGYAQYATRFSDVSADDWFLAAVGYFAAAGVIQGYPDGTFGGDIAITRAEFATILSRLGERNTDGALPFNDVQDHWARDEILTAYNNKWVYGYPDGSFMPDANITRAEAVAMVNRMIGRDPTQFEGYPMKFSDVPRDEWYYMDIVAASNDLAL